MRPHDGKLKKFKLDPRYPHHRSEGMTRRRNRGSVLQPDNPSRRQAFQRCRCGRPTLECRCW